MKQANFRSLLTNTSLLLLTASVSLAQVPETSAQKHSKSIFNGKDLVGWDGNPKLWFVEDGALTGRTTAEDPIKGNTFLIWTNGTVGDFELRCSFKILAKNTTGFANSGIQYRSVILDPKNWVVGGYQADMEAGPTYTGILYEERMTRGIMAARGEKVVWDKDCKKNIVGSLGKSEDLQAAIRQGEWNDYVIIAQGNHLQHFINGKQTVDIVDECESKRATNGVLALQLHAGQPMMVQFKDLQLAVLSSGDSAKTSPASQSQDLKSLQGVWQATKAEQEGSPVPSEDLASVVVKISGNSYQLLINDDKQDEGTLTLDPSKSPKQMDIHRGTAADGRMMPGIYEVGPDSFKLCYGRDGAPRPKSFSTDGDSRFFLISYKHKKD